MMAGLATRFVSHCRQLKITHVGATLSGLVAMPQCRTFVCIGVLFLGTIVDGNAASTLKMTCNGNLSNTRADGVTLGQCDLNFISVKRNDRDS
jgi:hypothetical protein